MKKSDNYAGEIDVCATGQVSVDDLFQAAPFGNLYFSLQRPLAGAAVRHASYSVLSRVMSA
jgi:hypothetical protein